MAEFVHAAQSVLACACGILLAACVLAWLALKACPPLAQAARRMGGGFRLTFLLCVFVAAFYGGAKSKFTYDGGIRGKASQPSYTTNDTVCAYWERDPGAILPLDSPVYIDYRLSDTTNEWELLGSAVVSDFQWTTTLADATNYDFNVWAYYIPPEPVHTNGVWSYTTDFDIPKRFVVPLKADVRVNGKTIVAPRKEKEQ